MADDADLLATQFGFTKQAAQAWLDCEGGPVAPNNPLNARFYGRPLQYADVGGFGAYHTYHDALVDYQWVIDHVQGAGYEAIRAQRGSGNAYAQARAIELSSWAGGHYGATITTNGCVSRNIPHEVPKLITLSDQTTELLDVTKLCTAYKEDFATQLGQVPPQVNVSAYGIIRPRQAGAALTAIKASFATGPAVGWIGVDCVANRRVSGGVVVAPTVLAKGVYEVK